MGARATDRFTGSLRLLGVVACIAAVGFAGVTVADDYAPTEEEARTIFVEVDTNGDGGIDRDEYYRRMVDIFYHNDADKNGYLNRDELVVLQQESVYELADENGDGKLTMAEYIDQRFVTFREVDVDSNGMLTVEEVIAGYVGK